MLRVVPLAAALGTAAFVAVAKAAGSPGRADVAALQVALHAKGLYAGPIDGIQGPATERAVRRLQRRARLPADGVVGPMTRPALGRFGRPLLGTRILHRGLRGWDVAALQFQLAWHGFPSGAFDGHFGERTRAALRRFQHWAGLTVDGRAGPATIAALRSPPPRSPLRLAWPLQGPVTDGFGPRGVRFHAGIDFPAPTGTPVAAAAAGRIVFANWHWGGFGYMVTIDHGSGVRTRYAHLSRIDVRLGARIATGTRVGLVGSSGYSTGPHLHFEVRLRRAAVDPLAALQ